MTINLPDNLIPPGGLDEESLRRLNRAVSEAAALELYRQGKLTHLQLGSALEMDRWQTEALLKKHGVIEDLMTQTEFRRQVESIKRLGA